MVPPSTLFKLFFWRQPHPMFHTYATPRSRTPSPPLTVGPQQALFISIAFIIVQPQRKRNTTFSANSIPAGLTSPLCCLVSLTFSGEAVWRRLWGLACFHRTCSRTAIASPHTLTAQLRVPEFDCGRDSAARLCPPPPPPPPFPRTHDRRRPSFLSPGSQNASSSFEGSHYRILNPCNPGSGATAGPTTSCVTSGLFPLAALPHRALDSRVRCIRCWSMSSASQVLVCVKVCISYSDHVSPSADWSHGPSRRHAYHSLSSRDSAYMAFPHRAVLCISRRSISLRGFRVMSTRKGKVPSATTSQTLRKDAVVWGPSPRGLCKWASALVQHLQDE
ncbi:hypothetical protein DFH94DRAFT_134012 [Russula ochroleuca]|uniref:Uncharacterized protein n=1 Tax=Russula ochroleuca TaxID=152965 RepID=A0A9P5K0R3_9AGAM|nr:hypothetical protein DFH94DRAFT_134012 [Russula ochroleuca]